MKLFGKDQNVVYNLEGLEKKIGYIFQDKKLLKQARIGSFCLTRILCIRRTMYRPCWNLRGRIHCKTLEGLSLLFLMKSLGGVFR